ncbi:N-acylneuraminate-9-phosphatase isoform X1 [Anopheles funestus]|uniref:N-acylneuraminate-9-phosphatase isoform X1 n=1 Tax=Anopheles funestus TaxID=62324 RepID=UPI0020C6DF41|nr:N-acylneuraminate-9-phosphatase isoform X1 [Anopheles funestus]
MSTFRGAIKRLNCDSKISAIFFDLDNTLIATRKADAKACSKVADLLHREHGLSRELASETTTDYLTAFRRCPDNPDMALAQWRSQLWQDVLPVTHKHLASELYGRWLEWRYRYLALPTEVQTMLQTLRLQYLLGIITNGPTAAQWEKIDRLALNKYFDCILVSSDLPWAKPDRNIFYAACHYLGVPPGQCVMIGDKLETDIQDVYFCVLLYKTAHDPSFLGEDREPIRDTNEKRYHISAHPHIQSVSLSLDLHLFAPMPFSSILARICLEKKEQSSARHMGPRGWCCAPAAHISIQSPIHNLTFMNMNKQEQREEKWWLLLRPARHSNREENHHPNTYDHRARLLVHRGQFLKKKKETSKKAKMSN